MAEYLCAKDRILETVVTLLQEQKNISKISNRQLATMAEVNSTLINYYYQSKENLVTVAIGTCMEQMTNEICNMVSKEANPINQLKNMLKAVLEYSFHNEIFSELSFVSELKHGNLHTTQMILPILKEIFGTRKSEMEYKLIALQLIIPLQIMFLYGTEYNNYLLSDIQNIESRNILIDHMVKNLLYMDHHILS